ncbi:MAG: DNA-binding response regulator KdpE [uncultured Phycisphaerae bacterium]|uniref:DNA-binding response regulator KdpE n=1 Tax=uncultured Phycisphaerae bacterium TaxID=904963 RepID=A0A6J4P9B1_9BACT|nr:MAG: DNA-binding response regulator KdpE [uncultured Phycisphaerae bacterium]
MTELFLVADNAPVILVIEDEPPLQKFLRVTLTSNGYHVVEAATGESGVRHAANDRPDLIILDLGLPDIDGIEVTRRIREWSAIPIIVVSARGKEQDKVVALDAGADDYLTKPFGVGELLARVRVARRHLAVAKQGTGEPVFESGELRVDLARREVAVRGAPVRLTPNEFRLLAVLVKHAGMVMTHRQLLREVWGPGSGEETHYLRVYMNQLRQKIEAEPARPKFLVTETGVGYRLVAEP